MTTGGFHRSYPRSQWSFPLSFPQYHRSATVIAKHANIRMSVSSEGSLQGVKVEATYKGEKWLALVVAENADGKTLHPIVPLASGTRAHSHLSIQV